MQRCATCGAELPVGARFCPSCASPVTGAPQVQEERKLVTVLFADVTGSTALGERLDPERLRAVLQAWYSSASAAIEAWGGTVEKFIGDAVVAVFGVPVLREDDGERALRAALDVLERLPELNRRFMAQHGVELAVRIGVNSGEVIAPAAPISGTPLVTGDVVNVAARLEGAAEPGAIMVGERTYLATRGAFRFGDRQPIELRGKAEPVVARRLLEAGPESQRGIPGLQAPMVGRERELKTLTDTLDQVIAEGRPSLALVYGPAGIGKSRLLAETLRVLGSREPPVRVLRGRCLSAGQGVTYWALAEVLRGASGITLDEPAEAAREKLRSTVRDALGALAGPEADQELRSTLGALALTAGISLLPDEGARDLAPAEVAAELARAWPRFVSGLTTRGPVVIAIEDLHWASDELVTMIERLLARSSGPVLLIGTARPEFAQSHPGFAAGRDDVVSISLRPLSGEQGSQLVDELLATADLPDALRNEIIARAEGNPFFLEEILRRLIDEGALVRDDERWRATQAAVAMPLPDTVQSLLAARIDALRAEERRVLQEAAVIGRIFWAAPLDRMVDDASVGPALEELEARGLVAVRPTSTIHGQVEYIFRHALIRDVAYGSLPRKRRARAHAEAAAWIEDLSSGRGEEFVDLIANHYAAAMLGDDADLAWADDPPGRERIRIRAFAALMSAGDAARRRYDLAVAVQRHTAAVELATDDDQRARAYEGLGDDEEVGFHGEEAWAAYESAAEVARRRGDRAAVARLALKTAHVSTRIGTFRTPPPIERLEAFIDEGLAHALDETTRARLLIEKGANLHSMWDAVYASDPVPLDQRIAATREAAAIAEQLGDPALLLDAEMGLGLLHWIAGDRAAVRASADRTLELADQVTSRPLRALTYYEASVAYRDPIGDYETSLELARRSYDLARELSPHELMHATGQWMLAAYWLGRWDEVDRLLPTHLTAYAAERDRTCSAVRNGPAVGALMRAERGDAEGARELLAVTRKSPLGSDSASGLAALAEVALGDLRSALERTSHAVLSHRRAGYPYVTAGRIEALLALGDWDALANLIPSARDQVDRMRLMAPIADRAEAAVVAAHGDNAGAIALLRRAVDGFEELRVPVEGAATRERLAALVDDPERSALLDAALSTYDAVGASRRADALRSTLTTTRPVM